MTARRMTPERERELRTMDGSYEPPGPLTEALDAMAYERARAEEWSERCQKERDKVNELQGAMQRGKVTTEERDECTHHSHPRASMKERSDAAMSSVLWPAEEQRRFFERSPATAEQRRIDENARKAAKEIVDGQKLETLEEAKRFAQNWIETAAQHSRNEEYFRKGRDEARAALARLVKNHDSETYVSRERRRAAYSAARTLLADTGPGNVCLACGALLPHDASSYCANGWKTTASVEAAADQPAPPGPAAASTSAEFDEKLRWTAVYEAGVAEGRRLGASVEAAAGVPGQSGPGAASTPVTRCQTCSVPILKGTRFCESCLAKWIAARSGREVPNEDDLNVAREIFETHLFKAKIHAPRSGEKMRLARMMTDAEIASELESLGKKWDAFRDSDDEGHGGSPGEWMVERMGELETEQKRRSAVAVFQGE